MRQGKLPGFLTALVALLLLSGCQFTDGGHYLKDRCNDLFDVVHLSGGVGPGLDLNLCASRYLQVGLGYYNSVRLGWEGRELGIWKEESFDFNLVGPFFGETNRKEIFSNVEDYPQSHHRLMASVYDEDRTWMGLSARIHALLVGAGAGLEPIEAVDFLLGIFALDARRDDYYTPDQMFRQWNICAWKERIFDLKTLPAACYFFDENDLGYVLLNHENPEVKYFAARELGRRKKPVVLQYLADYQLKVTRGDDRVKKMAHEILIFRAHYLFLVRRLPTERNLLAFRRWLADNRSAITWADEYENFILPQAP